jgi:hypothetical protein
MSRFFARGSSLLALLALSGCLGASHDDSLGVDEIAATSEHGWVDAELEVVGSLATGPNDFQLALRPRASGQTTTLEDFRALMPAHGHVASPEHITPGSSEYSIAALPLAMPGRWH